jgi:hypothetical protein
MSVPVLAEPGLDELGALYGRYKRLALATGATLVLGEDPAALADAAAALLADSRTARGGGGGGLASPLSACVCAADELHALLVRAAADPSRVGAADTDRVRATHSSLRREVWKVIPCEYVPCSAVHRHDHRGER